MVTLTLAGTARAQTATLDRESAHIMLQTVQRDLHRLYYDTAFGGHDLDSIMRAADARLDSAADNGARFSIIAQAVLALDDSHTSFWPPNRVQQVEYGFGVTAVGDSCYIEAVDSSSDAWAKGLRPGDFLYAVERHRVTPRDLWRLSYLLVGLAPRTGLELIVAAPNGPARVLRVQARVHDRPHILDFTHGDDFWNLVRGWQNDAVASRNAFAVVGDVLVWRLPSFMAPDDQVREGLSRARDHRALVLDLRHNPGGAVDAVRLLLGGLLGPDSTIGYVHQRHEVDTIRTRRAPRFEGQLIVLTDGQSASGSEVTSGNVQVFHRGTVIGDRTMGALMTSIGVGESVGNVGTRMIPFGLSVTISDYLLPNGVRLEKAGVTPDQPVLESGEDIATGADPVLARALSVLGQPTSAAAAGRLLPPRHTAAMVWKSY